MPKRLRRGPACRAWRPSLPAGRDPRSRPSAARAAGPARTKMHQCRRIAAPDRAMPSAADRRPDGPAQHERWFRPCRGLSPHSPYPPPRQGDRGAAIAPARRNPACHAAFCPRPSGASRKAAGDFLKIKQASRAAPWPTWPATGPKAHRRPAGSLGLAAKLSSQAMPAPSRSPAASSAAPRKNSACAVSGLPAWVWAMAAKRSAARRKSP